MSKRPMLPPGFKVPTGAKVRSCAIPESLLAGATIKGINMPELSGPVLALDPSSTCTGWALFGGDGRLQGCGVIRPKATLPSLARIDATTDALIAMLERKILLAVVMEFSAGKTAGRLMKASGLAILGQAQGAVRERIRALGFRLETVDESWTNRTPKPRRAALIAATQPVYASWLLTHSDPGYDAADAIGIGRHWIDQERIRLLKENH